MDSTIGKMELMGYLSLNYYSQNRIIYEQWSTDTTKKYINIGRCSGDKRNE